ncbi:hypothetical protein PR202_gb21593 [Eleusine coracana subsp. coracana]|uniref:Uncharacterized protein n=1 Tax=Eleusine coracana subsp. coracana TaxID=191504 RepID=A0AAV5FE13_ELECO|nr:hypothetical protein PR202_gb21593 [Eleusine coracana subsp. coracana]
MIPSVQTQTRARSPLAGRHHASRSAHFARLAAPSLSARERKASSLPAASVTAATAAGGDMSGWLKALAYGAGGVAVAGLAALVALQERLVYVPVLPGVARAYPFTPARLGLTYEDVWLRAADGVRLHSWFIRHSPTCRGKRELTLFDLIMPLIGDTSSRSPSLSWLLRCSRWYGESEGYPSQKGITYDAQAALDHLVQRKDIDTSRIVVFGRSLGGAVGAVLAKNNRDKVKQPILFLSGLQDELVPPSHMKMLYDRAIGHNKNCRFVDFPNGMHMDTWVSGGSRYWRTIQLFLDHYAPEPEIASGDTSCNSEIAEDGKSILSLSGVTIVMLSFAFATGIS